MNRERGDGDGQASPQETLISSSGNAHVLLACAIENKRANECDDPIWLKENHLSPAASTSRDRRADAVPV
jgi:hypothetical protein